MVESTQETIDKKERIRKEILQKLYSQSSFDRINKSKEIQKRLFNEDAVKSASSIMFYVSKSYEVDTYGMMQEGLKQKKRIIVPVIPIGKRRIIPSEINNPDEQLEKGPFGIEQPKNEYIKPVPPDDIDVVITPGIAFDVSGNRIGHGAGYYDTFLKSSPMDTPKIGIAFDFQIVKKIPTLSWDIPVTKVISA